MIHDDDEFPFYLFNLFFFSAEEDGLAFSGRRVMVLSTNLHTTNLFYSPNYLLIFTTAKRKRDTLFDVHQQKGTKK